MPESNQNRPTSSNFLDIQQKKRLDEMNAGYFAGKLDPKQCVLRNRLEKIVLSKIASPQQRVFYLAKLNLTQFSLIEKQRPLTNKEHRLKMDTLTDLWNQIRIFGISEAQRRMGKYRLDGDAFSDVQQAISEIFLEQLPNYNPLWSTPTTFFKPYFNQAITEYLLSNSQHLSQYDAKNVGIVRKAIYYFESQGIKWDESMIVDRTKLSPKVVKQTIQIASNSIRANVDDMGPGLAGKIPGPEEHFLDNERRIAIRETLNNTLTPDELEFFLYRVNLDGKHERPYQTVAEDLKMTIRDVKKKWSAIIAKLNNATQLEAYRKVSLDGSSTTLDLQTEPDKDKDAQYALFISEFQSMNIIP